jgi:hypothetical protein
LGNKIIIDILEELKKSFLTAKYAKKATPCRYAAVPLKLMSFDITRGA